MDILAERHHALEMVEGVAVHELGKPLAGDGAPAGIGAESRPDVVRHVAEDGQFFVPNAGEAVHHLGERLLAVVAVFVPIAAAVVEGVQHFGNGGPAEEREVDLLLHVSDMGEVFVDRPVGLCGLVGGISGGEAAHEPREVVRGRPEPGCQL